jgi:hypothetical protein
MFRHLLWYGTRWHMEPYLQSNKLTKSFSRRANSFRETCAGECAFFFSFVQGTSSRYLHHLVQELPLRQLLGTLALVRSILASRRLQRRAAARENLNE